MIILFFFLFLSLCAHRAAALLDFQVADPTGDTVRPWNVDGACFEGTDRSSYDLVSVSWSVEAAGRGPATLCATVAGDILARPVRVTLALAGSSTVGSGNRVLPIGGGTRDARAEEMIIDPNVAALLVASVDVAANTTTVEFPAPDSAMGGPIVTWVVPGAGGETAVCIRTPGAVPGLAASMASTGTMDGSSIRVAAMTGCTAPVKVDNRGSATAIDTLDAGGVSTLRVVSSGCDTYAVAPGLDLADTAHRRAILFYAAAPGDPVSEVYARVSAEAQVVPDGFVPTEVSGDAAARRPGEWCPTAAWRAEPRARYKVMSRVPGAGPATFNVTLQLVNGSFGGHGDGGGGDAVEVDVVVTTLSCNVARVTIAERGALAQAWRVPDIPLVDSDAFREVILGGGDDGYGGACGGNDDGSGAAETMVAEVTGESPFGLRISRDGRVLLDTTPPPVADGGGAGSLPAWRDLVVRDGYLEMTSALPEGAFVSGLGERTAPLVLERKWRTYTMWNRDHAAFDGIKSAENLYGSHPLLMVRPNPLTASRVADAAPYGLFLVSSAPLDVMLGPDRVQFRATAGVLDLIVMDSRVPIPDAEAVEAPGGGPMPSMASESLLATYHAIIGRPMLQPLWALGWHSCRWGIPDVAGLHEVVAGYDKARIPLDVVWSDIDYMDRFRMFTTDPVNYPAAELSKFTDALHADGRRYVVIVDPGVRIVNESDPYRPYHRGIAENVFSKPIGKVWPGLVHFPDWFAPNTARYWSEELALFANSIGLDGLWIDMNEVASFQPGHCVLDATDPRDWIDWFHVPCTRQLADPGANMPRYWPGGRAPGESTIDLNAAPGGVADAAAPDAGVTIHATAATGTLVHNLFGLMEARRTAEALAARRPHERPFVLTRSTFPGSGRFAAHWLGDNASTLRDMAISIPGILAMNLFGIPNVGSDACGFQGNTTEELCAMWLSLATLTPFARTHDELSSAAQEPFRLGPMVQAAARDGMAQRYALLFEMYNELRRVARHGGAAWRALVDVFPDTYAAAIKPNAIGKIKDLDNHFLIGSNVLCVAAVTLPRPETVVATVPVRSEWIALATGTVYRAGGQLEIPIGESGGSTIVLARAGTAIFTRHAMFRAADQVPPSMAQVAKQPFGVFVFPATEAQQTSGWGGAVVFCNFCLVFFFFFFTTR
jgi:alpha-glucosidase (family GH31 glycosyl hydrolase)